MQDFSSAVLGTSGKEEHQGQQVFKPKKKKKMEGWEGKEEKQGLWNRSIVSVERTRSKTFNGSLSHASAGTVSTQGVNKCSAGFLKRQFGDSDAKF